MSKRSIFVQQHSYSAISYTSSDSWIILTRIEQTIKQKIKERGTPLSEWGVRINYGIKTGYNEAFIINSAKKEQLISEDPRSAEIIRPILRGRDIRRYGYVFSDLWVINTHNGVKERGIPRVQVEDYPAIKAHLNQFLTQLSKRADKGDTPYNLRNCAYMDDFSKPKICWIELTDESKFSYSDDGIYLLNTVFFMVGDHIKYLLAVLNSKLIHWYFLSCTGTTSGVGTNRWLKYTVETIPIPRISTHDELEINALVDSLLSHKQNGKDTTSLEREIDRLVLHAYNLTEEEQSYIMNVD